MIKSEHRNLSVVCEKNYDEPSQDAQCRIQNSKPTPSGRKFSHRACISLLGVASLSLAYYAKNNWAFRTLTLLTFGILSSLF